MNHKSVKNTTAVLFFIYLILLSWLVLFKMQPDLTSILSMNYRSLNLIPFAGSAVINGKIDLSEIFWNAAAFVPPGVYLSILKEQWTLPQKWLPIILLSLLYECIQYVLAIGASDITDLLMNALGGLLGIGAYTIFRKISGERAAVWVNRLAAACTAGLLILACILYLAPQ